MALSDGEAFKKRRVPRRPLNAGKGIAWSDSQKLEAVQTYLMLGSTRLASAALKIPENTIKIWRTSTWWKDLESELKIQDELQLSTRLKKIAEKSFAAVEDRLEHGNFVFDQKTGKIRRIPVNLKDAHKVAVDSVQQQEMIARKHVEVANDGQIMDKLKQLAEKFAEMATDKFREIKDESRTVENAAIVDVESDDIVDGYDSTEQDQYGDAEAPSLGIIHALHDQRKTRLQEGEPTLQLEAQRTKETQ